MTPFNKQAGFQMILPALTVAFGMQCVRALLPYLQYLLSDRFGWSAVQIGLLGWLIFSTAFLTGKLNLWLGLRRMLLVTAGGVGLARLAAQLWTGDPLGDLVLVSMGTVLFGLFLPAYLAVSQWQPEPVAALPRFALALLLGLSLDTTLHGFYRTYDLIWQAGAGPLGLAVGLALIQGVALYFQRADTPPHPAPIEGPFLATLPWAALGPFFFLELLVFQNQARLATLTGGSLPVVFGWTLLTQLLGLQIAALWRPGRSGTIGLGLVLVIALWPVSLTGPVVGLMLLAGQLAVAVLLTAMVRGLGAGIGETMTLIGTPLQPQEGLRYTTLSHGLGMVMFVLLIFAYYIVFSLPVPYENEWLLTLAGLLVALGGVGAARPTSIQSRKTRLRSIQVWPFVLLLSPLLLFLLNRQALDSTRSDPSRLRVLTYNVHNGFNTEGQLAMEALAGVIEAQQPDIVMLQEVSRGWAINGSLDMFTWLSRRLGLPYGHFTPASDALWGHAVLSRYPFRLAEDHELPPRDLPLKRGFAFLQVDLDQAQPVFLINTHLHNLETDREIRRLQIETILRFLDDGPSEPLIMTGDLNATPDSPEIQRLYEFGFRDAVSEAGLRPDYTFPARHPSKRLDYLLTSPDLAATDVIIPRSTASDHFGIAATIKPR